MRWSTIERDLRIQHGPLLAGVDEVGRGPLAGPVVACAVIMPPDRRAIAGINDSKQLSAKQRAELVVRIRERALAIGIGAASVREIDRFNIYQASVLAIRRALGRLPVKPDHVVVDGNHIRTLETVHTAVVHGDARCYSIACASIVAKITRDHIMHVLGRRRPGYRWDHNVGYATAAHIQGIADLGITPHHRRSFLPVRQLSLDFGPYPETEVTSPLGDSLPVASGHGVDVVDAAALTRMIAEALPDESGGGINSIPSPEP